MELSSMAGSALQGARYHFEEARRLAQTAGVQTLWQQASGLDSITKRQLQEDINRFHWHLRAFFWELVATYDTLLYEVKRQVRKHGRSSAALQELRKSQEGEWFFEVSQVRNFAHRSFLFIQGEFDANNKLKLLWLLPAREGQPPNYDAFAQLASYLDKMRTLVLKIFPAS